jgi:hypothetical protein
MHNNANNIESLRNTSTSRQVQKIYLRAFPMSQHCWNAEKLTLPYRNSCRKWVHPLNTSTLIFPRPENKYTPRLGNKVTLFPCKFLCPRTHVHTWIMAGKCLLYLVTRYQNENKCTHKNWPWNENTRKLRNEVTLFFTGMTLLCEGQFESA